MSQTVPEGEKLFRAARPAGQATGKTAPKSGTTEAIWTEPSEDESISLMSPSISSAKFPGHRLPLFRAVAAPILLLLLGLSGVARGEMKKLIILGDSITEGYGVPRTKAYPALLQKKIDKLGKKWQVVNAGISGTMAAAAPVRIESILKQKPAMVLLALGTQDGLQGIKPERIEENLGKAIEACKKTSALVVLAGMVIPASSGTNYSNEFEVLYPHLAEKYGIPLIPYLLEGVGGIRNLNLDDGIHPNDKGHEVIADRVFQKIRIYL